MNKIWAGGVFTLLFLVLGNANAFSQNNNSYVQTFKVTSVTLTVDTISNMEQLNKAKNLITKHPEIRDFDMKGRKCNFTLDNTGKKLDVIVADLRANGYTVAIVSQREDQTFTSVPVRQSDPAKAGDKMSKEESLKLHEANPGNRNDKR